MTCEIRAHRPGAVPNAGQLISQLRLIEHFLDIAQAIRPVPEILAGQGSCLFGAGLSRTIEESSALCGGGASLAIPLLLLVRFSNLVLLALAPALVLTRLPPLPLAGGLSLAGLLALAGLLRLAGFLALLTSGLSLLLALLLPALPGLPLLLVALALFLAVLIGLALLALPGLPLQRLIRSGKLLLAILSLRLTALAAPLAGGIPSRLLLLLLLRRFVLIRGIALIAFALLILLRWISATACLRQLPAGLAWLGTSL